ncbi:hypothetical protein F4778DRAFT_749404 [Xylariomycetidae sp. FL2044]|nr:hypothetical protein F4778DRAFT_749404 [Xylariomycetidae sp. FL2044]
MRILPAELLGLLFGLGLRLCAVEAFVTFVQPYENELINAGSTYEVRWNPSAVSGDATLSLLSGENDMTLSSAGDIDTAVDIQNGSYYWEVGRTLGTDAFYGLKLTLNSDTKMFEYGSSFKIAAMDGVTAGATTSETASQSLTTSTAASSASGSVSATTTSAQASSPSSSSSSSPPPEADADSSNTGAVAGTIAGIVTALVVLFGILIALIIYYRRKARPSRSSGPKAGSGGDDDDTVQIVQEYKKAELDAQGTQVEVRQVYELDATEYAHEVDATTYPTELDSSPKGGGGELSPTVVVRMRDLEPPRPEFPSPLSRPGTPLGAVPPSPMSTL